ncbi:MAG: protein kinase, partial [Pseudonocardia sp.]|nr:protein kinase [Pseudonocardia sp.]
RVLAGGPVDARAAHPDATRMLPQPVGGPELLGGRYRLEGLIGQGGMADVHRATDTRLNRPVAVKIFGPGNDPTADARFRQEAQVMANLHHPGLVAVHDFAVEPHRAYLVMELVDGPTLREVIEAERLPADDIRRFGLEVAQTLTYVHAQGVTHRDVKPSNILIDGNGRARLADFGVASLLGAESRAGGHTAVGEIVGTPAYLAPEQVRGRDVGPPADVYALGLVLLEAWTGRREYQGEGIEGAGERLTRSPVVPRDVLEPLRGAIAAMTTTDPSRRVDAREAAGMLSAAAGAAPPPPPAEEPREERDLGSSRTGRWIAIGAFVVVVLVLLIGLLVYNTSSEETTPPRTTESSTSEAPTTSADPTETSEAPSSENDGTGFPTRIPGLPTELPSNIPTELPSMPSLPSNLPSLPSNLPDPTQIGDDARGFWDQVSNWWSGLF